MVFDDVFHVFVFLFSSSLVVEEGREVFVRYVWYLHLDNVLTYVKLRCAMPSSLQIFILDKAISHIYLPETLIGFFRHPSLKKKIV